jgi:hypothetical protein
MEVIVEVIVRRGKTRLDIDWKGYTGLPDELYDQVREAIAGQLDSTMVSLAGDKGFEVMKPQ